MHLGEKSTVMTLIWRTTFIEISCSSSLISNLPNSYLFYVNLLGSDSCRIFTQKDILKMFYELLGQDSASNWDENYSRDWSSDKPECEWIGVTCEEGEVTGLSFPNSGLFKRGD